MRGEQWLSASHTELERSLRYELGSLIARTTRARMREPENERLRTLHIELEKAHQTTWQLEP